ncbi:L-Ala-D/L-amino acid epimerase-like [Macadamia integrifolia]|uniref:L-Ala-D/L-amino acid epimerase-like n=1 Tax=Macadamia integrifolia TaxID=60698 RepID=UPI001C4E5CC7|nr:L-Ala-D/L-amino acid epimerase-like [Macadamia integrifolia]
MDPIGVSLYSPSLSIFSSFPLHTIPSLSTLKSNPISKPVYCFKTMATASAPTTTTTTTKTTIFGFNNLIETFTVDVHRAEGRPLNVPLIAPFTIANSRLDKVENVAIRVELNNGCAGWGEAPILPFVTAEDQSTALVKAGEACEFLSRSPPMTLSLLLREIGTLLPGHKFASVRAGFEMALIDAVANSIGVPLWRLFGGASNTITTDITIPIVSPTEASRLASNYQKQGFGTLKLKVGKNLNADIESLKAIRLVHPHCLFILDANEGYTSKEAIEVLEKLHEMGVTPVLFEQPVHRDDWEGLGQVNRVAKEKYGISVAADESCRSLFDVQKIIEGDLADVINIKLAKFGVMGALEIIEAVRRSGLSLMIGGMVETRLAMGFAGQLAAGLGCFEFVDLDTPLLLSEDPVFGGYEVCGAVYNFTNARGHGGFLHWDTTEC